MNENMKYLNDLSLDTKILPQVMMKIPRILQIRLTLNKHENISYFNDIATPSILLIDENDQPVFCFRCNLENFAYTSKPDKQVRRLEDIDTSFLLNKPKNIPKEMDQELKNSMEVLENEPNKETSGPKVESNNDDVEDELKVNKPKLVQNFSINPDTFENDR